MLEDESVGGPSVHHPRPRQARIVATRSGCANAKEFDDMSSIPFASRVAVPESVLVQELQGDTVFLNLDTESYLGLDHVGTSMWNALINSPSVQDAYERLLEEYEVEPERLRGDLSKLIEDLVAHGLVRRGE